MPDLLSQGEIDRELGSVPEWKATAAADGRMELSREFRFPAYLAGIEFVNEVAKLAEAANHHPDIFIGWRRVTLRLSTHSAGGLTVKDFELARKIDQIPR